MMVPAILCSSLTAGIQQNRIRWIYCISRPQGVKLLIYSQRHTKHTRVACSAASFVHALDGTIKFALVLIKANGIRVRLHERGVYASVCATMSRPPAQTARKSPVKLGFSLAPAMILQRWRAHPFTLDAHILMIKKINSFASTGRSEATQRNSIIFSLIYFIPRHSETYDAPSKRLHKLCVTFKIQLFAQYETSLRRDQEQNLSSKWQLALYT